MSNFMELIDLSRFLGIEGTALIEFAPEKQILQRANRKAQRRTAKEKMSQLRNWCLMQKREA